MLRPLSLLLGAAILLVPALTGCDYTEPDALPSSATAGEPATPLGRWGGPDTPALAEVVVMSQNLYLGADFNHIIGEPNPLLIPVRVAETWAHIVATDPPARMAAIAAEIARVRPALVGLQEVVTYYLQVPGDNLPGGGNTTATDVAYDFLDLLLGALSAEGLTYTAVSVNHLSDIELPATTDGQTFFDVRYRDADVVLALSDPDVTTGTPTEAHFQALLTIPVGGVLFTSVHGYQSVPATVDGYAFTFVNTHLETTAAPPIQVAQGNELKAVLDGTAGAVVLTGDLNSDADGATTPTYATITATMTDVFSRPNLSGRPTCCQEADLRNAASVLYERVDFVLYRGFDRARKAETLLDEPGDRIPTASGLLWPTDHAGVAALLVQNLRRGHPGG